MCLKQSLLILLGFLILLSLLILSMSIERFYATYYPFRYRDIVSTRLLSKVAVFCFLLALGSASLTVATQGNVNGYCFFWRPGVSDAMILMVTMETLLLQLFIPSVVTFSFNLLIIFKLKRRSAAQRIVSLT